MTGRPGSSACSAPRLRPCGATKAGSTSTRSTRTCAGPASGVPVRDPDVPESDRPNACRRATSSSVELAAEHDLPALEDDPYGAIRFEGDAPPTSSIWTAGSTSRSRACLRRLSRPASASAISSCRNGLRGPWSLRRPRPTSPRRYLHRRRCTPAPPRHLEQNVKLVSRSSAPGGRPCSPRSASTWTDALEPARGRLLPPARLPGRCERAAVLHAAQGIGVAFIAGPDFYPWAGGGRSRPAGAQLRLPGAATGGCQAPGGASVRGACGRPATAVRRAQDAEGDHQHHRPDQRDLRCEEDEIDLDLVVVHRDEREQVEGGTSPAARSGSTTGAVGTGRGRPRDRRKRMG